MQHFLEAEHDSGAKAFVLSGLLLCPDYSFFLQDYFGRGELGVGLEGGRGAGDLLDKEVQLRVEIGAKEVQVVFLLRKS